MRYQSKWKVVEERVGDTRWRGRGEMVWWSIRVFHSKAWAPRERVMVKWQACKFSRMECLGFWLGWWLVVGGGESIIILMGGGESWSSIG